MIVGGGIAGMTAAWDLSAAGYEVQIVEAADRLGGAISTHTLAGVEFDAGAEAFATRSTAVPQLIDELGLGDRVVEPTSGRDADLAAWLQLPDLAAPMPATGILGIPADPQAADVVTVLGAQAAARAAEDLQAPVDRWREALQDGRRPSLGEVVRDRMGQVVLDRLVTPIVSGVYSADPDEMDMETAAPGLFAAMVEEGSLARAVAALKAAAPAGAAVNSLQGGLSLLVVELERQLRDRGVRIHLSTRITELTDLAQPAGPAGQQVWPDHVILAIDGPAAVALAAPHAPQMPELNTEQGRGVALVPMLLDAPQLNTRPRGSGMLVAPSVAGIGAKAMTHISAKWDWAAHRLEAELGEGHHLVRLSYGRVTDAPKSEAPESDASDYEDSDSGALGYGSTDEQLLGAAAADVGKLFGTELTGEQILDADVVRWRKALPQTTAGHRDRVEAIRASLDSQPDGGGPRLHMIGAWFAGTGLARIIPDARSTARRIIQG